MDYLAEDNIIVCSSGHISNVAISKIRLSGKIDFKKLSSFFSKNLSNLPVRYAHYLNITDNSKIIDDVICIIFKAPHSYTGEDLIELDVHGSVLNVSRILNLFTSKAGFRLAGPGEFSYRALKNRKLTLSQVEGLDLILNANSIYSLEQGRSLVSGKIREDFEDLYQKFLAHKSAVELSIDFLEDMGDEHADHLFKSTLDELSKSISKLHEHISNNSGSIVEPKVSLLGEPNAGKSTFFNKLLSQDRSIVSNIAGTTRDYVSECFAIDDILFKLVDTAGLRESLDQIEAIGVERSLQQASDSFINVLIINPISFEIKNYQSLKDKNIDLILFTHSDQEGFLERKSSILKNLVSSFGPIEPLKNAGPIEPIIAKMYGPIEPVSEKSGPIEPKKLYFVEVGSDDNSQLIYFKNYLTSKYKYLIQNEPFLVERHSALIDDIATSLKGYQNLSSTETDISIISSELGGLGDCISELIGIVSPDDVLRNIFSNFCIGK